MRHAKMKNNSDSCRGCGLMAFLALSFFFIVPAFSQDTTDFKTWTFPYQVYTWPDTWHGPIQSPADGYLGIRVKYTRPQNDPSFYFHVTVHWPLAENNCYPGSIPIPSSMTSIDPYPDTLQGWILPQEPVSSAYPAGFVETIREYGDVPPDTVLFDEKTAVPAGLLFIEVFMYSRIAANKNIPYELTVFWERAFPGADAEYNRVFDKPLDLGRMLAPFEISSHIGFILPSAFEYGGQWACVRDNNDYFKFKVQKTGYYVITYASTNDWGVDTSYHYCRPVAGLQELSSSGMKYLKDEWWLKEQDRIGRFYFQAQNTYFLDLQSAYWSSSAAPYECNASVLFTVQYEGYVKYDNGNILVRDAYILPNPTPLLEIGRSYPVEVSFRNSGTVAGRPMLKLIVQNPSGTTVHTSSIQVEVPAGQSISSNQLRWNIPETYKDEGMHNIMVEILENTDLKLVLTAKVIVVRKIPPMTPILNLLLRPGLLDLIDDE